MKDWKPGSLVFGRWCPGWARVVLLLVEELLPDLLSDLDWSDLGSDLFPKIRSVGFMRDLSVSFPVSSVDS